MPESFGIDLCGFLFCHDVFLGFLYKKTENLYKFPVWFEEEPLVFSHVRS